MKINKTGFQSGGCRCSAWFYTPITWRHPSKLPTIVLVPGGHGFVIKQKERDCGFGLAELAKTFAAEGFAVCGYDGRGQGESEGKRTGHNLAFEDLEAALACIRESFDPADGQRIGLIGQSLGGMASAVVAGRDKGIRSLVLWGTLPRYTILKTEGSDRAGEVMKGIYEEAGGDVPFDDFVREFKMLDAIDYIGQLDIPILLAGGSEDNRFFRMNEQAELLEAAKASQQVMLLKVKGEPHRTRHWSPSFPLLAKLLSAWFSETL